LSRRQNSNPAEFFKYEQVFVAGDDHIRFTGKRRREHHIIVFVSADAFAQRLRPDKFTKVDIRGQSNSRGWPNLVPPREN
jgi:hypothetical protein